ncbi:SufD family Fe-S cluster assembly protein [Sphingomonas hylomeconis]|uniref:SufD family Fe-S cluster assembly protein n=1 Tax=Sphingomonas hylomeconis TaxID=1395958 RepID=A0ABV7SWP8_9SPHN|nr:SufD family Fe-S cluster assembly protein [Sphingomonas hylomeconis]
MKLPTRRDESWRYSDLEAVASVWPVPAAEIIDVPAGTHVSRVIVQDVATDAVAIRDYRVILRAGATATFHVLNVGGTLGRVTIDVTCHEGAHFELGGAILGGDEQTLEIVTVLNHIEPNATSNQVVRSVLAGRATGSYLGKVAVARHAQKTDASQSVKAMLLSRTATANAKPELEIFADDVKCAHGATVGELDANALFYLASRGIAPAEAKAMLLRAFIGSVFEGIEDEAERAAVEAAAQAALERMLAPLPPAGGAGGGPV